MSQTIKTVALFSGGLDSILAAKLIQEQGVEVRCLHFYSPFFGHPDKIAHWRSVYELNIVGIDVGEEYVKMLLDGPTYGFGSVFNPCVDCKILMIRKARIIMKEEGACAIISGEVLGQRPMSQRREPLNIIRRDAEVRDVLLRPLSAQLLDPTSAEEEGLIDRSKLLALSGRGRKAQLALAAKYNLKEIPTPAGGCLLAEQEAARCYWAVMSHKAEPTVSDFYLVNAGRQFWRTPKYDAWLTIGRKQADNEAILALVQPGDFLLKVADIAGPVALLRGGNQEPDSSIIREAAAYMASFAPKAVKLYAETKQPVLVRIHRQSLDGPKELLSVVPDRQSGSWAEPAWETAQAALKEEARRRAKEQQRIT